MQILCSFALICAFHGLFSSYLVVIQIVFLEMFLQLRAYKRFEKKILTILHKPEEHLKISSVLLPGKVLGG